MLLTKLIIWGVKKLIAIPQISQISANFYYKRDYSREILNFCKHLSFEVAENKNCHYYNAANMYIAEFNWAMVFETFHFEELYNKFYITTEKYRGIPKGELMFLLKIDKDFNNHMIYMSQNEFKEVVIPYYHRVFKRLKI